MERAMDGRRWHALPAIKSPPSGTKRYLMQIKITCRNGCDLRDGRNLSVVLTRLGRADVELVRLEVLPPRIYLETLTGPNDRLDRVSAALSEVTEVEDVAEAAWPEERRERTFEAVFAGLAAPLTTVASAAETTPATDGFAGILGTSAALRDAKERAARFADVDAPLLIAGESGVGKRLFAHAIHRASPRRAGPFLALDCGTLPENLLDGALFGYAPEASGAGNHGRPGILEMADGGTALLHGIEELSPYLRAKLIRFIEDGTFRPVGAARRCRVDLRLISTTRQGRPGKIADGRLRDQLTRRLAVLTLIVPPLRERREDIPLLARRFVARAARHVDRRPPRMSSAAKATLLRFGWPDNVRQLENVLFRAVTRLSTDTIEVDGLGLPDSNGDGAALVGGPETWAEALASFESELLRRLYPAYPSARKLANRLGVSHTTINHKLRAYGIRQPQRNGRTPAAEL